MTSRKIMSALAVGLCSVLVSGAASAGFVWNEVGAGELPGTAETVSGSNLSLDAIRGTLSTAVLVGAPSVRNEVDVYRIVINDAAGFSARTVSANTDDTSLFLFDAAGRGVFMNDDYGSDLLSALPGVGGVGTYFLAVGLGGFEALDEFSAHVFLDGMAFTDLRLGDSASGPWAGWSETFPNYSEVGLPYEIVLTGAFAADVVAVPEPSSLSLLVLAGVAAGWVRRRHVGRRNAA